MKNSKQVKWKYQYTDTKYGNFNPGEEFPFEKINKKHSNQIY